MPWPLAIAATGHLVLLGGIAVLIAAPPPPILPPTVPVEIVSAREFQAFQDRASPLPAIPAPVDAPVPAAAPVAEEAMTVATALFAGAILEDPANQRIREALPTLERSERLIQLCNLEGLEQLRLAMSGTVPDFLVAYAYGTPTIAGFTLDAPGAAFHEGTSWRHVRLTCTVSAGFASVTDFRFAIGNVIPEAEWAAHNLPAIEADGDDDDGA